MRTLLLVPLLCASDALSVPRATAVRAAAACRSATSALRTSDSIAPRQAERAARALAIAGIAAAAPLSASAAESWVEPTMSVLSPSLFFVQFIMLARVLLSWYPEIDLNVIPFNIIAWPTEPLLHATRNLVPPAFGVDISPIVWIAVASLASELLLGQQGVLVLMSQK